MKMAYFRDVLDLMLLKEDAYRKIGNDRKAFARFTLAFLVVNYAFLFLMGILFTVMIGAIAPFVFSIAAQFIANSFILLMLVLLFLLMPFISYLGVLILSGIQHLIGLAFGGKPLKFTDFVKVSRYPDPFVGIIASIVGLSSIYGIWKFFVLYKTYKIIHKLSPKRAGWAVAVNVMLVLAVVFAIMFMYFRAIVSLGAL